MAIRKTSVTRIYAGDLSTATQTMKKVAGLVQKVSASDGELIDVATVTSYFLLYVLQTKKSTPNCIPRETELHLIV